MRYLSRFTPGSTLGVFDIKADAGMYLVATRDASSTADEKADESDAGSAAAVAAGVPVADAASSLVASARSGDEGGGAAAVEASEDASALAESGAVSSSSTVTSSDDDEGVALACANPACCELQQAAHGNLLGTCRRFNTCGGCKRVRYCCDACCRADWPRHHPECGAWRL
jgi:hypothetical protein